MEIFTRLDDVFSPSPSDGEYKRNITKKAIPLRSALVEIVAITSCSGGTQATNPQIIYRGDYPEAARFKAHATCLAAAFEYEGKHHLRQPIRQAKNP